MNVRCSSAPTFVQTIYFRADGADHNGFEKRMLTLAGKRLPCCYGFRTHDDRTFVKITRRPARWQRGGLSSISPSSAS
jgi:hypothetical protein